ncbi:MAG: hypothetical protein WCF81_14140 [Roseiarcus sp.]
MSRTHATLISALSGLVLAGLAASAPTQAGAEESLAYDVQVSDVTAKVGEPAVIRAVLTPHDGYRILKHYTNRVSKLSSFDDGVAFERQMVPATLDGETLVFEVPVHATKAGKHPINGIIRVGYIHGTDDMSMVSLRLIANVIGAE